LEGDLEAEGTPLRSTANSSPRAVLFFLVLALGVMLPGGALLAQAEDQMCLMCHGDRAMLQGVPGADRLLVTQADLAGSVHGAAGVGCTLCHQNLPFPHTAAQVPPVDCSFCHSTQGRQHAASLHGLAAARGDSLAPSCVDCHGSHDVLAYTNPASPTAVMNIPLLCGECHREGSPVSRTHDIAQDRILENYSMSIHGEGLFRAGLTVTAVCTSCHTSHNILPHEDRRSSIHRDNVAATCSQCHTLIEQVHRRVIEGRLWEEEPHKIPACVDCHQPHVQRRVFYDAGTANEDCLSCHRDQALVGFSHAAGDTVSLFVDENAYLSSRHAGTPCAQCHTGVTPGLVRPCETATQPVDCSICHAEVVEQYSTGMHGILAAKGDPEAPVCLDCHSNHATLGLTNPISPTYARNVPDLCATCHRAGEAVAQRIGMGDYPEGIVASYEMSIHGEGLIQSGLVVTATCDDCHTPHRPLPADHPESTVHPSNIAATCGTCHHGIEEQFQESIHWVGRGEAGREYPTCEDCHTSHAIGRTDRGDFRIMMMSQCGRCHLDETHTFFDTFHGKVSRLGDEGAAKCYDCHGTHNIFPVDDPRSTLSRENVLATCAQCHPRANERFTGYLTHATHHDPAKYPWLFYSFWGMTALLIGTLTLSTLHTGAWLWRLWRSPEHWRPHRAHRLPKPGARMYRRFSTFDRILHGFLILSFFTLAITGMVLKFSYMGWAQLTSNILGGFAVTGALHRLAAIVLISIWLIHLREVVKRRKASGKTWLEFITDKRDSLLFTRQDLHDLLASIRWFFGRGPRPEYGRWTYWEKFDYFAVFWGMFIIGTTGMVLWFPEFFTLFMPGKSVNVATIVHSDEALLAVAFIFTVHFFNTHFRPDKFPMDPVIFTGRVSVEELKADKPREYEELAASGELEKNLHEPYPRNVQVLFRVIGFTALTIGLTLIALIVYSMLWGYR
jgi:cytochrome b subunit of formate dehydrogenase